MSNISSTTHSLSIVRLSVFASFINSIEGHLEKDDSELSTNPSHRQQCSPE
jgi:hypothetical protein